MARSAWTKTATFMSTYSYSGEYVQYTYRNMYSTHNKQKPQFAPDFESKLCIITFPGVGTRSAFALMD